MFRYVALIWQERHSRAAATARRVSQRLLASSSSWQRSMSAPGFMLLHADARPGFAQACVLAGDHGAILGNVFRRDADATSVENKLAEDAAEAEALAQSGGRRLITEYWGRYVAFLRDPARRSNVSIVRDPVGDLPCYRTVFCGVELYFSCAEDCAALGLLEFKPNWPYISAFMCYPTRVQSAETGLEGVSELMAGERWQTDGSDSITTQLLWNPIDIAGTNAIERFDEAVEALRHTTQSCVWAWAQSFPRIVHLLSGGLDSSIVLACLHAAPSRPTVTCLNYFDSTSSAGDERGYARLAAQSAGCELIEAVHGTNTADLHAVLDIARSVKPYLLQYNVSHSAYEGRIAGEARATALFYGNGGDQIFFQSPVELTAADYAYRHGFGLDLLKLVARIAYRTRLSFWRMLGTSLSKGLMRPSWDATDSMRGIRMLLIDTEVLEDVERRTEYLAKPQLRNVAGLPWGKLEHVRMMWAWRDFFDPLETPDYPQRVRPLTSQPLIELCLRIPTYLLARDGQDRAVARKAFAAELPRRIVSRHSKGIINSSVAHLLRANWEFLKGLMLDGTLVRQGLLDRRKVEDLFAHGRASFGPEVQELVLLHLSTEAWLRRWHEIPRMSEAASV